MNYGFMLSNGRYVKYLLIDGYEVADLKMDGVLIKLELDENYKAVASISSDAKEFLGGLDYKNDLLVAEKMLVDAIKSHDFSQFSYDEQEQYDKKTNSKYNIIKDSFLPLGMHLKKEEGKRELVSIVNIFNITKEAPVLTRLNDFQRTVESLKMFDFVNNFRNIQLKVVRKY